MQDAGAEVRTTCPYCGVGCGVIAKPDGKGGATVEGDKAHPANYGRLCSKGSALGETLGLETRLLSPMQNGALTSWDAALDAVADGFRRTITAHGPDAVAIYLSGQLLTEDYYVANKLMKGFIGSGNVDTNSRLCMSSTVAGQKRVFGADAVPGCYEDLDEADLFVLVGSNAAWCHPVLYQRMVKAQETRGAALVNIDPRVTATCETATLHLPIAPGQDGTLFSGLLVYLADNDHLDHGFIAAYTEGFDDALARAREIAPSIAATALRTRLPAETVRRFFALWAQTERVVTLFSQGVNQSAQGTDKVVAILNCHLAAGRIGRVGMGPFSLTGQPNAMGGREVGGLANQLAAHMSFTPDDVDRVRRFWNAPNMATREGKRAVDLFEAVGRGEIKALWVLGTNPAVSLPRADAVRQALARLDLLVVSDNVTSTDTITSGAHILLPAAGWGEKDGTVTNSERRISRQRAFLPQPGAAKPDWWAVCEVAKRLGFKGFDYPDAAAVFAEHAALSAFENDGTRDFDIGGLAGLSTEAYDALLPSQWPRPQAGLPQPRLFSTGGFFTPSRRARFQTIATPQTAQPAERAYPLLLNTGRVRDQWHTMTRTGLSQRLASHVPEPFLAINPADAAAAGVRDGGLARVSNPDGTATLRVVVTASQHRGAVFAPIHWTDETAASARIGSLVHAIVDPYSGQPDAKATPVAVSAVAPERIGFILARQRLRLPGASYWAWEAIPGGYAATLETDADPNDFVLALGALAPRAAPITLEDRARGLHRTALIDDERLVAVLFIQPQPARVSWHGLRTAWAEDRLQPATRRLLLSGKTRDGEADEGPNVCACFGVPRGRIEASIASGIRDVAAIGAALRAGTNCGSCIPEIKRMIGSASAPAVIAEGALT